MDHTSIPKMQEATGGANNNYSTLEVAIGAPDYDKEVVHPPHKYPDNQEPQYYYNNQIPGLENGQPDWAVGADTAAISTIQHPVHERRILGLKRRTFFIIAWIVTLLIAVGIGVGAGLGATMRSRDGGGGDSQGAAAGTTSQTDLADLTSSSPTTRTDASIIHSKIPGASDTEPGDTALTVPTSPPATKNDNNNNEPSTTRITTSRRIETTPPPPPPTTTPPKPPPKPTTASTSTTSSTTTSKTPQIGGPNGRCVNAWGSDCICLDESICKNKWKGTPYTGFEGNWPCPNDPDNIMACVVRPCLGQPSEDAGGKSQCLWREACSDILDLSAAGGGGATGAPVCPGDGDFVCCAHPW